MFPKFFLNIKNIVILKSRDVTIKPWAIFRLEFQMLLEQSFITFYVNRHTAPLNNQQELTDKS